MNLAGHQAIVGSYFINLSGPLNAGRSEEVIHRFRTLRQAGVERVTVNLKDVPFIDSRGLAALIAGYKIFGGNATNFRLIEIQDQPQLVFELTGFDRVFQSRRREPEFQRTSLTGCVALGRLREEAHVKTHGYYAMANSLG